MGADTGLLRRSKKEQEEEFTTNKTNVTNQIVEIAVMDDFTNQDMEEAIKAIISMIDRSEKAQKKFAQGTSQYTLQKNRINALYIALSLVKKKLAINDGVNNFANNDFEKALAPITSLISKSEKAQKKLSKKSWQYTMIGNNLKALEIALPMLKKKLSEMND